MVGHLSLLLRILLSSGFGSGFNGAAVHGFGGAEVKAVSAKVQGTIAYAIEAYQREMQRARAEKARLALLKLLEKN